MQTPCRRHPARVCDQREHQRDGSGVSTGSQEVGGIEMPVVVAVDSIDVESNNTILNIDFIDNWLPGTEPKSGRKDLQFIEFLVSAWYRYPQQYPF